MIVSSSVAASRMLGNCRLQVLDIKDSASTLTYMSVVRLRPVRTPIHGRRIELRICLTMDMKGRLIKVAQGEKGREGTLRNR
jgi:hypothetical protein